LFHSWNEADDVEWVSSFWAEEGSRECDGRERFEHRSEYIIRIAAKERERRARKHKPTMPIHTREPITRIYAWSRTLSE